MSKQDLQGINSLPINEAAAQQSTENLEVKTSSSSQAREAQQGTMLKKAKLNDLTDSQGYSAERHSNQHSDNIVAGVLAWFRAAKWAQVLCLVVLAFAIEIGIFNHWAIASLKGYEQVNIDVSAPTTQAQSSFGRIVNSQDSQALVLENIKVKPRNLYVQLYSDQEQMVQVKVEFTDMASRYNFAPTAIHQLNTQGEYSSSYFHFNQRKDYIYTLRLTFKSDLDSAQAPVYLQKLTFNYPEPINISYVRLALLLLGLLGTHWLISNRAYGALYDPHSVKQRLVMMLPLVLSLVWALIIYGWQRDGITSLSGSYQSLLSSLALLKLSLIVACLIASYAAFCAMLSYFKLQVNALLLWFSLMVVLFGSQVFYQQADLLKESVSPLICSFLMALAVFCAYSLKKMLAAHELKRGYLLALALLLVTALLTLGLSRMLVLILALALCSPLWLNDCQLLYRNYRSSKAKSRDESRTLIVPVLMIGSLLVSGLVRTISSEDYLQAFLGVIAGDALAAIVQRNSELSSIVSIEQWANAMHYYFFETLNYFKNFPLVVPATENIQSFGLPVTLSERISVTSVPFAWIMFLPLLPAVRAKLGSQLVAMSLAVVLGGIWYAYGSFYHYGTSVALATPLLLTMMIASALILLALFGDNTKHSRNASVGGNSQVSKGNTCEPTQVASKSEHLLGLQGVLLIGVLYLALKSIVISLLVPFAYEPANLAGQFFRQTNLDVLLYFNYFFNSLGF